MTAAPRRRTHVRVVSNPPTDADQSTPRPLPGTCGHGCCIVPIGQLPPPLAFVSCPLQCLAVFLGMGKTVQRIANAPTLEEQRRIWDSNFIIHFVKQGPKFLVWLFVKFVSLVLFNKAVLWFGGGVPGKQAGQDVDHG